MKKYNILLIFILGTFSSFSQIGCSTTKLNLNAAPFYYPQCFLDSIYLEKTTANQYLYINSQKKIISKGLNLSAGRGLTLNNNIFRLDTTKNYNFTNGLIFGNSWFINSLGNTFFNNTLSNTKVSSPLFEFLGNSTMASASDGNIKLTYNVGSDFDRLQFGGTTSSYPAIQRKGVKLVAKLSDNSANTNIQVKDTVFSNLWNGQIDVPTKNSIYDKVITLVSYTDTATMLSKYLRSSDTVKLHNQVAAKVKYTDTATMLSPYALESKIYSGTYTPSASDLQNVTSVSFTNCGTRYMRINNIVSVTGAALITITTSDVFASFELTLPIPSSLSTGTFTDIAGVITGVDSRLQGSVSSENNHAQLSWGSSGLSAGTYFINYTYSYNIN